MISKARDGGLNGPLSLAFLFGIATFLSPRVEKHQFFCYYVCIYILEVLLMKRLYVRKTLLTVAVTSMLCLGLCGCEEVFVPVENGTVGTNPYIYWNETTGPTLPSDTIPTETTAPVEEGEVGYVVGGSLNIRSGPGTEYDILGTLTSGDQVIILEQRIVGSSTWGRTASGWVSMNYISLGEQPSVIGTVTAKSLNVRQGPGTSYDTVDTVSQGDQVVIYEQTTVDGKTWGRTDLGWISLQYVSLQTVGPQPDGETTVSIGTVTGKTLNVRDGAGTGYDVVDTLKKGDEVTILEQVTVSGDEWGRIESGWISLKYVKITGTTTIPSDQIPTRPPIKDTSIIGTWVSMDEQGYFSGSDPDPTVWSFHEDGTYTRTDYDYTHKDNVGWQSSGAGTVESGTFQFNGKELKLTSHGEETTMSVTIELNTMAVHGHRTHSMMLRTNDVNALIKALIRDKYDAPDSQIHGSWMSLNTSTYAEGSSASCSKWYFGTDGSFSETAVSYQYDEANGWVQTGDTVVYSGYYFYDGSRLTLCYETATNGSTWETDPDVRYSVFDNVTVSSETIDLKTSGLYFAKVDDINSLIAKANG